MTCYFKSQSPYCVHEYWKTIESKVFYYAVFHNNWYESQYSIKFLKNKCQLVPTTELDFNKFLMARELSK